MKPVAGKHVMITVSANTAVTKSYHSGMQWTSSMATTASSFPKPVRELLKSSLHGGEMADSGDIRTKN